MKRWLRFLTWPLRWPGLLIVLILASIAVNVALVVAAGKSSSQTQPATAESDR